MEEIKHEEIKWSIPCSVVTIPLVTGKMNTSWIFWLLSLLLLTTWSESVQIVEDQRFPSLQRRQSNVTDLIVSDVNTVNLVLLLSDQRELPVLYEVLKPTLDLAIKEANRRYPHLKFVLVTVRDSNRCESNVIGAMSAEKYYLSKVNAFIGPICTISLDPVSRMSSYWNVPVFTAGGIGVEFANKKTFSTLTRVAFSLGL